MPRIGRVQRMVRLPTRGGQIAVVGWNLDLAPVLGRCRSLPGGPVHSHLRTRLQLSHYWECRGSQYTSIRWPSGSRHLNAT